MTNGHSHGTANPKTQQGKKTVKEGGPKTAVAKAAPRGQKNRGTQAAK